MQVAPSAQVLPSHPQLSTTEVGCGEQPVASEPSLLWQLPLPA
jgi:hypothetical protein